MNEGRKIALSIARDQLQKADLNDRLLVYQGVSLTEFTKDDLIRLVVLRMEEGEARERELQDRLVRQRRQTND